MMIGESFPESNQIMGAVISIRNKNGHKLAIWTKNAADRDVSMIIGCAPMLCSAFI